MKKPSKSTKPTPPGPTRAASLKAAAALLKAPPPWVSQAKASGCEGFAPNGTVALEPVRLWIEANMDTLLESKGALSLRDQKLAEEVRKLRFRNDREEGSVVDVSWVNERIHRLAGDYNALRSRMEGEAPVTLAACGGDVAACRTAFKGIMDGFWKEFRTFAKHFEK